ncbi:hypothetical protein NL676_032780 [Syzygium grande]|nr:hypothetical protein NL676_032780 [Syzygium grande]
MTAFAASGHLLNPTLTHSLSSRRKFRSSSSQNPKPLPPLKCHLSSSSSSSPASDPPASDSRTVKSLSPSPLLDSFPRPLASAAAATAAASFAVLLRFSPHRRRRRRRRRRQNQEWDSHGLPANIVVQLNKLSGFKKYKLSEILFFDRRRWTTVGTEDSFFEMVSLRPGGIYTKAQLQKELETLATCGMFEKVDMEGKTKADGTLSLTISFTESTWQSADKFRCINVGLMPQSKPIEMDPDMTDKEKLEYYRKPREGL